jgi:hypothetical protein
MAIKNVVRDSSQVKVSDIKRTDLVIADGDGVYKLQEIGNVSKGESVKYFFINLNNGNGYRLPGAATIGDAVNAMLDRGFDIKVYPDFNAFLDDVA